MSGRKRWDARHEERDPLDGAPAPLLRELLSVLPKGRALDVACGSGANARLLAASGYRIDALDWSVSALSALRGTTVRPIACDVTRFPLPRRRYDLVTCFRFLERSLWPDLARALRPRGALLLETFTERYLDERPGFPPAYCLAPGELLRTFESTLRVAYYREIPSEPTASLLGFRESTEALPAVAAGS